MQREKNNNFILDFTGVYDDEFAKEKTSLTWIDCTDTVSYTHLTLPTKLEV